MVLLKVFFLLALLGLCTSCAKMQYIWEQGEGQFSLLYRAEDNDKLLSDKLSSQENQVIGLYYGLSVDADLNLKEIGTMVGLSKERVRQVKENALAKLRASEVAHVLDAA